MEYIFIHGLGQNSSSWNETISYMVKPVHALCPDLSVMLSNKEVTYANLYDAFSEYCNSISEPFNLCGLSLGAVLALNYAIDNPSRVKSLVLIGAQYEMPKLLLKFQNLIFGFMPKSSFQKIGFNKKNFIQLTNSMMDLNFRKDLKNISCVTLVICGEKDKANKKVAESLVECISKAELQIVESAGHEVNVEAPKKLAGILETFYLKHHM